MGRRQQVPYSLNTGGITGLSEQDIQMILRGADELIATGGRSMLAKILKGSKDKKLLELHLDDCPAYGYFSSHTLEEISFRIDWMIQRDYLDIEYEGRLPMLIFTEKGWKIEKETYTEEIYGKLHQAAMEKRSAKTIPELEQINREVLFGALEKIRASRNLAFVPFLEEWKPGEVRKVRERISGVIRSLKSLDGEEQLSCKKAALNDTGEITALIEKTVRKIYPRYYPEIVADFFCMLHSKERIREDIQAGNVWKLVCDGRMVATGSLTENHITRVYVLPECQGKGYGRRMMEYLERKVLENKHFEESRSEESIPKENFTKENRSEKSLSEENLPEERLFAKQKTVVLDASLPACGFYEKMGYRTVRHEQMQLWNDAVLVYDVMEKQLGEKTKEGCQECQKC